MFEIRISSKVKIRGNNDAEKKEEEREVKFLFYWFPGIDAQKENTTYTTGLKLTNGYEFPVCGCSMMISPLTSYSIMTIFRSSSEVTESYLEITLQAKRSRAELCPRRFYLKPMSRS